MYFKLIVLFLFFVLFFFWKKNIELIECANFLPKHFLEGTDEGLLSFVSFCQNFTILDK